MPVRTFFRLASFSMKWQPDNGHSQEKRKIHFGGGALTDLMTHWIDVAHWYMDVPAPVSVVTSGNRYALDWECPDTITCALDYPKNFSVTYHGTMASSIDD